MAKREIDDLTMEQYLTLTRGNQASGVVKPEIGCNVNFKIKSQFMRELKEDAFSGNKNDDAHEHVERVLDILSLFNIPGVTHDAVMLRVFPITPTRAAKRYCPPSKTAKQLEDICNFKQEGPIPGMTPAQALTAIQTMADHSQKWHDGSSSRDIDSSNNSEGIAAIVNKLDSLGPLSGSGFFASFLSSWSTGKKVQERKRDSDILCADLGRDMKKLKENVHAIQVGCQTFRGAHLDKECPLNDDVKSMEEVKYGEFGRPFLNNSRNNGRINRGASGYDQPSLEERKPSLTEIINKYIEEEAKRHAEQDKWLKEFYQNTEINREAHNKIIRGLEIKVKTLTNEVEGRTNGGKSKECKTICTEYGLPLYTPLYYSPEEIEYFSSNSGFSDNKKQEIDKSEIEEALAALEAKLEIKRVPQEDKKCVSYYVEPYEPPIPFPRRLKHHAKEALIYETMKSLKKIKINRPLLKEIRQTEDYTKHMKNLVANKPRTQEEEVRMNPTLNFSNALADLGASISIMPLSMYKRLGIGKFEPVNMMIEMANNTKCIPKGLVENLLVKIDKLIFPVDFAILDIVEDIRMPIILGRPLLATAHAKVDIFRKSISLKVGNEKVTFKIRSSFDPTIFESVLPARNWNSRFPWLVVMWYTDSCVGVTT
ncbi:protein kinase-like domain, concanavalin A-like lectin/glucanase domain protein [Tanacetum coccineum]